MTIPFFSKLHSKKKYYDSIKDDLKRVELLIESQLEEFEPGVVEYMEKVCKVRGKLLRPCLVLMVAGATGGITDKHIQLAAIIEMLHSASLVHDDVMDKADTRRNESTANALWGNSLAVLLGDALFAHVIVMGTAFNSIDFCKKLAKITRDVCQGEIEQTSRLFDLEMTVGDYYEIIRKKTASLFAAASGGAAWVSGVSEKTEDAMYRFGELLGTAYQIYDDCLDMVGDEHEAGKTLHTDVARGKMTLPFFLMQEGEDSAVREEITSAMEEKRLVDVDMLMCRPVYRRSLKMSIDKAKKMNDEAREILWDLPQTQYRDALAELTFYFDELLNDCLK